MEFRQLEVFAAVAEQKSVSKAAEQLYLTQSTASSHLKNLERELGKQLIFRTTKHLQLTEEGQRLLPYARRILETRNAALKELQEPSEQLLHLGASTIPSGYLLPKILGGFRRLHPNFYFSIKQGDSREIQEQVLDGTLEVGFVGSECPSSHCVNLPFCTDQLVLVTPSTRHYLALRQQGCTYRDLLGEPIILRERGSGTQKAADQFLASIHVDPSQLHPVAEINDLESIKQMIVGGMGVSICSRFAVADLEAQGQAILYPLPSEIRRRFYITYLKARTLKPALRALIQYARDGSCQTRF